MDSQRFIDICKAIIENYISENQDKSDKETRKAVEIYVVWNCKTLQNNKALLSTGLPDGMYYELTYDGDKDKIYFDAYKKWENKAIEGDQFKHIAPKKSPMPDFLKPNYYGAAVLECSAKEQVEKERLGKHGVH